MKLREIFPLWVLISLSLQAPPGEVCVCEFETSEKVFPEDQLSRAAETASECSSNVMPVQSRDLEILLLGLERRLPRLQEDVLILEQEDDGDLYAAISLQVIENELTEIKQLMDRLDSASQRNQNLSKSTTAQLKALETQMEELETYDTMQVVKRQQDNHRLRRDLDLCRNDLRPLIQPTPPPPNPNCPHGYFVNVTGPRIFTAGEFPGTHKYGAWGRDPKPAAGMENWYWMVMLTSSNRYAHYVRRYSNLNSLIVGKSVPGNVQIHASNPTTNTVQGPNVVLYGEALFYNCYNQAQLCRFNLTAKTVTNVKLPQSTRYNSKGNYCHLDECYPFTDLDLMTDESGVWVSYTTAEDFGNLVLSEVNDGEPPTLGRSWRTSVYKQSMTNTFMVCGVLYATRYVDKTTEEIFYSYDTSTGEEKFNIGVFLSKTSPNIYSLNYSPVDQVLYSYSDAYMLSYKVLFSESGQLQHAQSPRERIL